MFSLASFNPADAFGIDARVGSGLMRDQFTADCPFKQFNPYKDGVREESSEITTRLDINLALDFQLTSSYGFTFGLDYVLGGPTLTFNNTGVKLAQLAYDAYFEQGLDKPADERVGGDDAKSQEIYNDLKQRSKEESKSTIKINHSISYTFAPYWFIEINPKASLSIFSGLSSKTIIGSIKEDINESPKPLNRNLYGFTQGNKSKI